MKYIYKLPLILMAVLVVSCSKDEFAELNTNPSEVAQPDIRFSVAEAIHEMYRDDYTVWFYNNFRYAYPWSQLTTASSGGGNSETMVEMENAGGQSLYPRLYANTRDVRARVEAMEEDEKQARRAISAMTFAIQIQPALTITDNYGAMVYTQGAMGAYTSPPLITPEYDLQEQLFDTWLEELDGAIEDLSAANQFKIGGQDIIYNGDYGKWAKFCNLLKLKIAARLVNQNQAKAFKIVEEVVNSPAGYMNDLSDDFIYHRGIKYYGTGNGTQPGIGSKNLIDFMVANKDPRVKVLFNKNEFNAEVVQAFIDAGKDLPPYVEQYVEKDLLGNFAGWSGPGEPWVRYHGVPLSPDATFEASNDIYFKQDIRNKITIDGVEKTYSSTSNFAERVVRTGYNHTYPTKPGGRLIELKDNYPPVDVILGSSAETNLYLAEFKLLGANISGSAQDYFNRGVELSVLRMDKMAQNHRFPYYDKDPVYTEEDEAAAGATKLQAGELAALLTQPAYDLSVNGLEKVYIQQVINFAATPGDLWTTTRRSGVPAVNSDVLPREAMLASGAELTIPRRLLINAPSEDNKNYENYVKALEAQGFSTGDNNPSVLNTERIWFDLQNPQYGEGPKN
ncbi:Starch-binding associating with outer membrane [Arenibacter nanhaiticus]|uniref:Starch-binding associating with outer membrane n=1 Tax=Arenibacter nanhaiticus TaxID=558155 RepID=A0A1M6BLL8_9FLAO|nr:SusD/RagB family nutrient-binding outer membrane lipoprotein [Arenibacter nanhaiticus]SHI49615.1 Starch-binding associating with outer membrane [Arenibacter nanhaiticus]